jgi:xanthine/CO dehydrogenase XdhC/CoxF family maturation factor
MKQFDEILDKAALWRKNKKSVALATVVSTWGSSPRPVGSQMAISEDLDIHGSVSGGCIEGSVITAAQEIMNTGVPKLLKYGVSNTEAWEVGLTCGGKVEVFVEKIGDND